MLRQLGRQTIVAVEDVYGLTHVRRLRRGEIGDALEAQFEAVLVVRGLDHETRLIACSAVVRHQYAVAVGMVHVDHFVAIVRKHGLHKRRAPGRQPERGSHDVRFATLFVQQHPVALERRQLLHHAGIVPGENSQARCKQQHAGDH